MATEYITVEGLKDLRKAFKQLEGSLQNELKAALKKAADIVADEARSRVPSRSGRARDSIRSGAAGAGARIIGGKASVPYYGWLDFGTRAPRFGNTRDVGPWAKSGKGPKRGRFIYGALHDRRADVVNVLDDEVSSLINKAGFD